MSQNEFKEYMEYVFQNLERAEKYYWEYKNQLKQFEFINKLAYLNNLINVKTFSRTDRFIKGELEKYL